jgi:hypothetical protein
VLRSDFCKDTVFIIYLFIFESTEALFDIEKKLILKNKNKIIFFQNIFKMKSK